MLKREMQVNLKSFIVWTSILIIIFALVFAIYPSIMDNENIAMMEEFMNLFPEEIIKMFNMDISSLSSAYGWFKTEGLIFILLIIGVYAATLGSNILLKEESDKTIEYLASKPIRRNEIITSKILCGLFYISLMIILLFLFNFIGLSLIEDFDIKSFILLSLSPFLIALPIFFICMFISTFFNKTKKTFGIAIGLVFISYFFMILSNLNENTEVFKYFSLYTLADSRKIILNNRIPIINVLIFFIIIIVFVLGIYHKYNRKELV